MGCGLRGVELLRIHGMATLTGHCCCILLAADVCVGFNMGLSCPDYDWTGTFMALRRCVQVLSASLSGYMLQKHTGLLTVLQAWSLYHITKKK
jgi:hypothetical protein